MASAITAISYAVPDGRLTHAQLCARFGDRVMEKIESVSGILERRITAPEECASDLAQKAALALFKKFSVRADSIDLLIMATQTPDFIMPTTACIMQDRLGLKKSCAAFDINLGCSQFIYSIATARAWIESGMATRALVLCADTPSKLINPLDRSTISLFGDGACAAIVEKTEKNSILDFDFGTDGSAYDALICPCSGMRRRQTKDDLAEHIDADGNIRSNVNMHIDGVKIFAFAYKTVFNSVSSLLKKNGLTVKDISLFIFHQAGEKIVSESAKRLKIPPQKVFFKMHDIGNCGGSSVGIAIAQAAIAGKLKRGDKIVCSAFGVGLSWGSAILEWSGDFRGATAIGDFSNSPAKPDSQRAADL